MNKDQSGNQTAELEREIGLLVMTLYAVGVMIGGGIYVLIGEVAGLAGLWTPFIFAFAGLAAGLSAASFAELSARFPEAGGSATYVLHGVGSHLLSVGVGLAVSLTGLLSAGAVLQGGVGYLQALIHAPTLLLIIIVGILLTVLALWGALESLAIAALLALVEIGGLFVIIYVAFTSDIDIATQSVPLSVDHSGTSFAALSGALVLAFFAFIGFEDVVNMAEEARNPSRTMPLTLLISFLIVIVIYGLVALAALRVASPSDLQESTSPLALVYELATGRNAALLSVIGVAAALNGVLAQIVMSARILLSIGRRTPALSWLGVVHPRLHTPFRTTCLAGAIVIALALTVRLEGLASATSIILLGIFVLINIALIRVKAMAPHASFTVPNWIPWVGAMISALILFGALAQ